MPLPDAKGREDILRLYLARVKIAPELDVKVVAKGTPGFSGADLENLVNQVSMVVVVKAGRFVLGIVLYLQYL